MNAPNPSRLFDAILEATIIGSFTKAGYLARSRLFDWNGISRLDGQTALVTGATSGIGKATARGLMNLGAKVIVTSRDQDRADEAAADLSDGAGIATASGLVLDTSDLDSVRDLIDEITSSTEQLDVLINNAGALSDGYKTDKKGMELTLSSHVVGPYLLTTGLRPHMASGGRILWMSSGGMYTQGLDVEHLELSPDDYSGAVAYARAKRAQVELVAHLGPRWAPDVLMHSMHPGWVDTPGVDASLPGFGRVMGPTLRTADQGADTMIWLAAAGGGNNRPGSFFLDRRPRRLAYLPGTSATNRERQQLLTWLDDVVAD